MADRDFHFYLSDEEFDTLRPVGGQVLIELKDDRRVSKGGVLLVNHLNPLVPDKGIVIGIGDDVDDIEVEQKIIFEKYMGRKVYVGPKEKEYLLLNQDHIMAILPQESDIGIDVNNQL